MKERIENALLKSIKPGEKILDIWDTKLPGFVLRVYPSGSKSFLCSYRRDDGRRTWTSLGTSAVLTPSQARELARDVLSKVQQGRDPVKEKRLVRGKSLRTFITQDYAPWFESHRRTGKSSICRLKSCFENIIDKPLGEITGWIIEQWRTNRKKSGVKPATINRDLSILKSCFSKAVEWEIIEAHPLLKVKLLKDDSQRIVRFLTETEELRLRSALNQRQDRLRAARANGNMWRRERGYTEFTGLENTVFVDHLMPSVLVSINTGMRRGELLSLTWAKVNWNHKILTVEGSSSKSGNTRHIPLNSEALQVLHLWWLQGGQPKDGLVFPSKDGSRIIDLKTAWKRLLLEAKIENFRWHDMRHHFASRLVIAGVNLNTVRELLGHSDIKMTLRYAHLSPEAKAEAVNRLVIPNAIVNPSGSINKTLQIALI